uniref:ETS domain-containing protein n=2 Tax=Parascaris univalens TaxID=6257 RepID=A0A915ANJ6_PARUN
YTRMVVFFAYMNFISVVGTFPTFFSGKSDTSKASGFISQFAIIEALSPYHLQMSLPFHQDHLIIESDPKRSPSANSHVNATFDPTNTQLKRSVSYGGAQSRHPDAFDQSGNVDLLADATTSLSVPSFFASTLLPSSAVREAHLDSKTPYSAQPSAKAFYGHMPDTVYLTPAPNITTSLPSDCNQQFLHSLSATSESFNRNNSAPSSVWKLPMSFVVPSFFASTLLPSSAVREAHLDSKTPYSAQPSAKAFYGQMPDTVYLTPAPNITTPLPSDCNQQFLHSLSATSESFNRNNSAPSSVWKLPMSFVDNGNRYVTSNQVQSNQLQLPLPTDNERAFFLKGCSSAALWNYLIECLIEPNDYGKVCSWTNLWEVSIRNTQLFTRNWNAYNPNKTKKYVSYMSLSRALKTFENTKWCGWVLLKKVPGRRSTYRFLPDHNSPMLPSPKESTPASFNSGEQPRRSSLLANNYYMSIEIGGRKRIRGMIIDEEPTLEEKMGIFRSKKQRLKYLRNTPSPKTNCFFEHNEMMQCNCTLTRTTSDLCSSSGIQLQQQQQLELRDILEGEKMNETSNLAGRSNNRCNLRVNVDDFDGLASALSDGISTA